MFLEDQIDDLPATQKPCTQQPSAKRVRLLVSLQICCSALLFPFVALALLKREQPRHWWSWAAVPLSILMSFTQLLAILPLVQ
jgi:hypothetical protein